MKIGILIKDFSALNNWELRIIDKIRSSESLELCLLIKDGRTLKTDFLSRLKRAIKSKNFIANVLFFIQTKIESKIFKPHFSVNRDNAIQFLEEIECIELHPKRKGFLDIFSDSDAEQVKKYELDIILRHEFNIIRGEILSAAKNGIWSFHHGDNAINRGGPPGFWEIVLKQPVIGVTLQQLTAELDGGFIIDKGFYDIHWSHYKNRTNVHESSVDILFKNIKSLERGNINLKKSPLYFNKLYKSPSLLVLIKYIFSFYRMFILRMFRKILDEYFGVKYNAWTLFIGHGKFLESTLFRLQPIKIPKNEFWADPFLFQHKDDTYVFFENYSYKSRKGIISCGKVDKNRLTEIKTVLEKKYHLSYPCIFAEGEDIYMIPETNEAKRVEVYKCVEFPEKWELYSTAFEGEQISDTTYYKDEHGEQWLFLSKGLIDSNSNLYIYKIDSLLLNKIEEHTQNPVIIDTRIARGAGPFYKNGEDLIRPSQNNIKGLYGAGLNLNRVKKLTLNEYEEEKIICVQPNFKKGIKTIHHLHQLDNTFIIDGSYKWKK